MIKKTISRVVVPVPVALKSVELHLLLQQIYANRGITSIDQLEKGLDHLLSYKNLTDIDCAVARLIRALTNRERILIVGDYDVDGATSTALMVSVLKLFGADQVNYLVPNRFTCGYGLTPKIVSMAVAFHPDLIVTVDNGIASVEGVDAANKLGIDVVITDHHLPSGALPKAVAMVNPNQSDDPFESKNLAGVGVAFYVCLAMRAKLREQHWFSEQAIDEPNLAEFLDLVALGTVADVVSLDQNNRILVYQGLQRIRAGKCCEGIRALIEVSKRQQADLTASDLSFLLGPRLNAAGRLDDMSLGIECLLSPDPSAVQKMALELNVLNEERKVIEAEMRIDALNELEHLQVKLSRELPSGICLKNNNWHQGIIGILASRIKDRFQRPVVAFAPQDEANLKGSVRSVAGVHVKNILESIANEHPGLITHFGGHAMAAGLGLKTESFSKFSQLFDEKVAVQLNGRVCQEVIVSDGALSLNDLTIESAYILKLAGPWGEGFAAPLFDGEFNIIDQRIIGRKHLKLDLEYKSQCFEAIAFNVNSEEWPNYSCERVKIGYHLDINEYRGQKKLQFLVKFLEPIGRN